MNKDKKIFLVATLIYAVFASLGTILFWVLVKTNTLPLIALLFTIWFLFFIPRTHKDAPAERLQRLRSLWIQGLISEEELQSLTGEKSKQDRSFLTGGFHQWIIVFWFYFRNILKNNEKRLQNLEAYHVKEKIVEEDYQTIRRTILRNL